MAYNYSYCFVADIIGYSYLCQVIVMTFLVIWLFVETKRAVDREMKQNGSVKHNLKKERCTYAVISIFFGLSYITRYVKNVYSICL